MLNGCQMPRLTRQSFLNNHKCPDHVRHDVCWEIMDDKSGEQTIKYDVVPVA
jgi:hypothetical protein